MNPTSKDIALYLASQGAGLVAYGGEDKWNISYGREPATPRNTVTIYDTGGAGPETDEMNLYRPSIQVRVRAKSFDEGWAKSFAIMSLLIPIAGLSINQSRYVGVTPSTEITHIGMTENDLFLFTTNYEVIRE